jgi:hypothetical protein
MKKDSVQMIYFVCEHAGQEALAFDNFFAALQIRCRR